MKERPILFSEPMVGALLAGTKKQTRRIFKGIYGTGVPVNLADTSSAYSGRFNDPQSWGWPSFDGGGDATIEQWPELWPFATGDRLWVREAFAYVGTCDPGYLLHRADYPHCAEKYYFDEIPPIEQVKWRPSIHMPRLASRMTLIVTDVRVERLWDISEADALAEGIVPAFEGFALTKDGECWGPTAKDSYRILWDAIHGDDAWDTNPWIVAISFLREVI